MLLSGDTTCSPSGPLSRFSEHQTLSCIITCPGGLKDHRVWGRGLESSHMGNSGRVGRGGEGRPPCLAGRSAPSEGCQRITETRLPQHEGISIEDKVTYPWPSPVPPSVQADACVSAAFRVSVLSDICCLPRATEHTLSTCLNSLYLGV